jgi:hypothetical protein
LAQPSVIPGGTVDEPGNSAGHRFIFVFLSEVPKKMMTTKITRHLLACVMLISVSAGAQQFSEPSSPASTYPGAILQFNIDSLQGFNSSAAENSLHDKGLYGKEFYMHMARLKRDFIKTKYGLSPAGTTVNTTITGGKKGNSSQTFGAPCVNEGFESTSPGNYTSANAVTGWTVTSHDYFGCITSSVNWSSGSNQFAIVATPITSLTAIGTLPHSPLGGTVVARLNNFTPDYKCTRISQTFPVTSSNNLFTYAFAGYWEDGGSGHGCCEQPGFRVVIKDCQGNISSCVSETLAISCANSISTYSLYGSAGIYTNWQVRSIDLTPFVGSCVTVEAMSNDCAYGGHAGVTYFDANCTNALNQAVCNCTTLNPISPVSFCPGGTAMLQAPSGYASYTWGNASGPLTSSTTATTYTVTNPTPGAVYNVSLATTSGCTFLQSFTLATTQVSVSSIGASATCSMGTSGSATVIGTGSGSGYNYIWTNASNSVIATTSVVNNLAGGIYSVQLSSTGSCGIAGATVNVTNTLTNIFAYTKPFCGTTAYFLTSGGSNFQWYSNNTPISGTIGTAPSLTVSSPVNGAIYRLRYLTAQGCRDSIIYTLQSTSSPTVTSVLPYPACQGGTNGQANITLLTLSGQITGLNSYSVWSTGTTPTYVSTLSLSSSNTYTANNLSAGGTYSVRVFDGSCYSGASFVVPTFSTANLYSLTTSGSPSVCQGNAVVATVVFSGTTSPAGFTYSWSPNLYLVNNNNTSLNTLITPTASPGSSNSIIYTVVVTPTMVSCPVTRTIEIIISNPLPVSISSPGQLCSNAAPVSLSGQPSGGYFINAGQGSAISSGGLLDPTLAPVGVNNFTYAAALNNCVSMAVSSYTILPAPVLSISGGTSVCAGQSSTLTASGAASYQWQGQGQGNSVVVTPGSNTTYTVTGTSAGNCSTDQTITVHVTPLPVLAIAGNQNVCLGGSTTLTASGAQTYSWNMGGTAAVQVLAPQVATSYTITGTNNPSSCSASTVITVNVLPLPAISVAGPDTVCSGDLVVLNAQGGNLYAWNGVQGTSTYSLHAIANTVFTVTGTDQNGCSAKATHAVALEDCTGLNDLSADNNVRVYPNPTTGRVQVILNEPATVTMHDAAGKLILSERMEKGENMIDLSSYSTGIYLLRAQWREGTALLRIIRKD